jgi:uncharacterized protein
MHSKDNIIEQTIAYVQHTLHKAEGGHDWWHIFRVWNNAKLIASREEKCNLLVVELAALLHDIADAKFNNGDEEVGPAMAKSFLQSLHIDDLTVLNVVQIIKNISFKNSLDGQSNISSIESKIVQDADRLDAIGAIGIARAFNYGGYKNRSMYDPTIPPNTDMTKEMYKQSTAPTLNHFYEKLFLLKDKMNTETGKALAQQRHVFMETYIQQFFTEWPIALDNTN